MAVTSIDIICMLCPKLGATDYLKEISLGSQPLSAALGAPDPITQSYLGVLLQGNCSSCPHPFARQQKDSL